MGHLAQRGNRARGRGAGHLRHVVAGLHRHLGEVRGRHQSASTSGSAPEEVAQEPVDGRAAPDAAHDRLSKAPAQPPEHPLRHRSLCDPADRRRGGHARPWRPHRCQRRGRRASELRPSGALRRPAGLCRSVGQVGRAGRTLYRGEAGRRGQDQDIELWRWIRSTAPRW